MTQKSGSKQHARPLKCKLCSRRFKYSVCLNDHFRKDHFAMILMQLKNMSRRKQGNNQAAPVKVSVIKQNF